MPCTVSREEALAEAWPRVERTYMDQLAELQAEVDRLRTHIDQQAYSMGVLEGRRHDAEAKIERVRALAGEWVETHGAIEAYCADRLRAALGGER